MIERLWQHHNETIINSFWRALQILSRHGFVFLVFIFSASTLSTYEFGIYNYVFAFIAILAILSDFGISTATSKFVAEYDVTEKEKIKLVLFNSVLLILIVSGLVFASVLIFGSNYFGENYRYVLYTIPLVFLIPTVSLYDGIYRGLKNFKKSSIVSVCVGVIFIFLAYPVVYKFGLKGSFLVQTIFYITMLGTYVLTYSEFDLKFNREIFKQIGKYAFVYGLAVLGYQMFAKIDVLILGHYGYIKEIGIYEFINKFLLILLIPFSILGQVVAPNFTRDFTQKKYSLIYKKLIKYSLFFGVVGVLIGVFCYFIFPVFTELFFNKYYGEVFSMIFLPSLLILVINVSTATIDTGLVVSTGFAYLMSYLYVGIGVFNILICLLFLKLFGFIGVIWGTVLSSIIMLVSLRVLYFYKIKKLLPPSVYS